MFPGFCEQSCPTASPKMVLIRSLKVLDDVCLLVNELVKHQELTLLFDGGQLLHHHNLMLKMPSYKQQLIFILLWSHSNLVALHVFYWSPTTNVGIFTQEHDQWQRAPPRIAHNYLACCRNKEISNLDLGLDLILRCTV